MLSEPRFKGLQRSSDPSLQAGRVASLPRPQRCWDVTHLVVWPSCGVDLIAESAMEVTVLPRQGESQWRPVTMVCVQVEKRVGPDDRVRVSPGFKFGEQS